MHLGEPINIISVIVHVLCQFSKHLKMNRVLQCSPECFHKYILDLDYQGRYVRFRERLQIFIGKDSASFEFVKKTNIRFTQFRLKRGVGKVCFQIDFGRIFDVFRIKALILSR